MVDRVEDGMKLRGWKGIELFLNGCLRIVGWCGLKGFPLHWQTVPTGCIKTQVNS